MIMVYISHVVPGFILRQLLDIFFLGARVSAVRLTSLDGRHVSVPSMVELKVPWCEKHVVPSCCDRRLRRFLQGGVVPK